MERSRLCGAPLARCTASGTRGKLMIGRLNHVAIAVRDIAKASAVYRDTLGADVSAKVAQPDHGVSTVFITLPNTKIELLEPLGESSPIAKFLDKNPDGGIHHVCYEVPDIRAARDSLKAQGARGCGAAASQRSARRASRCCSCIRRISAGHWLSWSRHEHHYRHSGTPEGRTRNPDERKLLASGFRVRTLARAPRNDERVTHDRHRHRDRDLFPDLVDHAVCGAAVGRAQSGGGWRSGARPRPPG